MVQQVYRYIITKRVWQNKPFDGKHLAMYFIFKLLIDYILLTTIIHLTRFIAVYNLVWERNPPDKPNLHVI